MVAIGLGDRLIGLLCISLIAYKFFAFPLFFALLSALIGIWIWFQYEDKQYWKRLGIVGPKPNIFFGNTLELFKKGAIEVDRENIAKYGKSFGGYGFDRHEFLTMEREKLKRIFVKDFPNFPNRVDFLNAALDGTALKKESLNLNAVSSITGDDWKRVRNIVTPAFTTGKLKKLIPTLCESTNRMGDFIEREYIAKGRELPLKDLFGRLVLDEIGRAGFSLDLDMFKECKEGETNNVFAMNSKKAFAQLKLHQYIAFFPLSFYVMAKFLKFNITDYAIRFFHDMMNNLYENRKSDPGAKEKYNDIFQLLMNTVNEGKGQGEEANGHAGGGGGGEDSDIIHKEIWSKNSGKQMSRIELLSQSYILLIAGYDTTASVLHFTIYLLAMHLDIQEKLRAEIVDILGEEENEISHEHLKQMAYVQAVVRESLRFYSPIARLNRECAEDIDIDGVQLRRGDIVSIPVWAIHHSDDFYSEPDKFQPERFMPDQKASLDPLGFLPFGFGPRNCIGMRVAEFQIYVGLAVLIRRFHFKPGPNTPKFPLELSSVTGLISPKQTLFVLAEKI